MKSLSITCLAPLAGLKAIPAFCRGARFNTCYPSATDAGIALCPGHANGSDRLRSERTSGALGRPTKYIPIPTDSALFAFIARYRPRRRSASATDFGGKAGSLDGGIGRAGGVPGAASVADVAR